MGKSLFTIFIISLAGLAILFQAIGLSVTAWKKFHVSGNMKQFMADFPSAALGARAGMNMMGGQMTSLFGGAGGSGPANGMPGTGDGDIVGSNTDGSSNANGMGNFKNMLDPTGSNNITQIYMDTFLNTQVSFDVDQGLWKSSISGCVNAMEIKACVTIESMPAEYTKDILVDFTTERAMCVFGLIAAVVGTILLVVLAASTVNKPMTVLAFVAWIVSALLGFIAAGLGANNENKNLEIVENMMTNTDAHFVCPWAIVMTGIGAFFALIVGIIVIARARQLNNNSKLPGTWNQFTNVAEYRDEN